MSTYSPAHIFVRRLEETCAYMGRDEEANDDARAPTTVGKLKPETVPVVSAVGHGVLAVAVPGGNTAVDAPAAALQSTSWQNWVARRTTETTPY